MCTALTLGTKDGQYLFGRTMDLEYAFNQAIYLVPRNYPYKDVVSESVKKTKHAILGMGTNMNNHPMLADAFNEKGLACAGLNFPGYAHYEEKSIEGKINLPAHDVILYILSNFENVEQVKKAFGNVAIINKPFMQGIPVATLHWIVSDRDGKSIVIESVEEGLKIYDNLVGVITNSPTFDYQITNLNQYVGIQANHPANTNWGDVELKPLGVGLGLFGLPGDFSPPSRFVRTAYLRSQVNKKYDELESIAQFFHIMNNVAMVKESIHTAQGLHSMTQYISCMNQHTGKFYYNTYYNSQINVIDMNKEDLDREDMKQFTYIDIQNFNEQN